MTERDFHPAADLFPLMEGTEFSALVNDIREHGLIDPIMLHSDGSILDGRNRYRACLEAGVDPVYDTWSGNGSEAALVISRNIHRRHLTRDQKHKLIAALLKEIPERSNRQIAKDVKADHKTVGAERSKLEATGEIPQLDKTMGADGKERPSKRAVEVGADLGADDDDLVEEDDDDDLVPREAPPSRRMKSRPARWSDAASRAMTALEELQEMQSEYQDWMDTLPDNLRESAVAEKLESITEIDFGGAIETVSAAEDADLPLGFGRD